MKQLLFVLALSLFACGAATAQPYAHVNFGNLLSMMPDVSTAEAALQAYEKEQRTVGEKMADELRTKVEEVRKIYQDLTPNQVREKEVEVAADQAELQKFERQMGVNIEKRRQELLGPIIERAKNAVSKVSQAKGYELVFDSSIFGAVLFAEEMTDLLPAVKAELGIE